MDQGKTGRFIAEKRKEKGMTQKELAGQLGIGDKAVSKWECGRGMPDNSIMLPLCDVLEINVNELLMGESLSERECRESSEDIILTLMGEKESLKKRNRRSLLSCVLAILFAAILFFIIVIPIQGWHSWVFFYDPVTLVMDPILVLIMLLATGNVRAFFHSFWFMRKKEADRDRLIASLRAVKLAIATLLLGGGLFTLLDTVFILRTMGNEPWKGVSVTLLTMLYGTLFALLLLPVKVKLESKVEEVHGESDKSRIV